MLFLRREIKGIFLDAVERENCLEAVSRESVRKPKETCSFCRASAPVVTFFCEALAQIVEFSDKITEFPPTEISERFTQSLLKAKSATECASVQFVESAIGYSLTYLEQADQGVAAGRKPAQLKSILSEQLAAVTGSVDGVTEDAVHPLLMDAMRRHLA